MLHGGAPAPCADVGCRSRLGHRASLPPDEKGEKALEVLNGAMEHYMFTGLDKHQRQAVIDQWRLLDVEAGHSLIQQGDIGESMFGACMRVQALPLVCGYAHNHRG